MKGSIKLFSVKGIEVKVHFTFALILIWAAYRWGVQAGEGLTGALFGVAVTLLLFACVTLHELAHSLTAMRYGVTVREITLLPIGGVAQMEEIPAKPAQELKMSLAGPLTNIAIAILLILICLPLGIRSTMGVEELFQVLGTVSWHGLIAYLVSANLTLGLFNLLPAFPMDGGRVLRAFLAMRMDYARATAIAVRIGQGLAVLLGLWGFMGGGFTLIFIAIFIYLGAGEEGRTVEVKSVLEDMQVRQAMSHPVQTLTPTDTMAKVVELILQGLQADFPVLENDRLVGMLTEGDVLSALHKQGADTLVGQMMRRQFPIARPGETLVEVQGQMSAARLRSVPVVERDRVVGLLTAQDINEAYRLLKVLPQGWGAGQRQPDST
ncbi:MAG: site-2 protease family protein [Chloroflexi bacterium]|nr:site-2 protease family protein [Chloroflexota bacterium]